MSIPGDRRRSTWAVALWAAIALVGHASAQAQTADAGRQVFASRCASCHGTQGAGGELGPSIVARVPLRSDQELEAVIREGVAGAGMPAFPNLSPGGSRRPGGVPAHAAAARHGGAPSGPSRPRRRPFARRRRLERESWRAAAARRRPRRPPASRSRRRTLPRCDVAGRVARLRRAPERQPLQSARAHHRRQRVTPRAQVGVHAAERCAAPGDAGGRRRRDVRDGGQRSLCARRRQRAPALELSAAAHARGWRAWRLAASIGESPSVATASS